MSDALPRGSYAVMAQRVEPPDALDYFPTPPWATRALCEWLKHRESIYRMTAWDPACGCGHMARPLLEYFREVEASDVYDYGFGRVDDFLLFGCNRYVSHWIITNPPFRLAEEFARQAILDASRGVALLVRTAFLESIDRYDKLFRKIPPSDILQFTERVPMHKGRLLKKGSTATAYCWIVWRPHANVALTRFHWIPPCRKRLERPEDYEPCILASDPTTASRCA